MSRLQPTEPAILLYGRTLRGLEDLACDELSERFGASIRSTGHREIFFSVSRPEALANAGLLDDVFILCGQIEDIDQTREALRTLSYRSLQHLEAVRQAIATRAVRAASMKVVASFLGRRNYNRYEIEAAVGAPLARQLKVDLVEGSEEEADCVLRIHLRDHTAILALRLFQKPLRQRSYKTVHLPGATPPQVGRALATLASLGPDVRVLDPYCGTATVLIEAGLLQPSAFLVGVDVSNDSLLGSKVNASAAEVHVSLCRMSAVALGFADRSFDVIAGNLPWGRQVHHEGEQRIAWTELHRVLRPEGRAIFVVHEADGRYPRFEVEGKRELRLYGQTSWIVTLRPSRRE